MAADADLFEGLDEIRWGEMTHAYGTAEEVPGIVRDLVDPDPVTRAVALHRFEGEVHHQLDVYESTLATVPFLLRIAQRPELPGRPGVVGLLASLAGADDPDQIPRRVGRYAAATRLVTGAYDAWVRLLDDADPAIRKAASSVLVACADRAGEVAEALLGRLDRESDPQVSAAIARAVTVVATVGRLPGVGERLRRLAEGGGDPVRRLTLLTALIALPPGATGVPELSVADVVPVVAAAYQADTAVAADEPEAPEYTLRAVLRRTEHPGGQGRRAPVVGALVDRLSEAFGDRVGERLTLLTTLLRSPEPEQRADALYPSRRLIWNWRGPYATLIALVGEQLRVGPPTLWEPAVLVLQDLRRLATPAADGLIARLAASPLRPGRGSPPAPTLTWLREDDDGVLRVGGALKVVCATGDPRAVPMVASVLQDDPPEDVDHLIGGLVEHGAPLAPLVVRAFQDSVAGDDGQRRASLLRALRMLGSPAAPALPTLLSLPVSKEVLAAIAAVDPGNPAAQRVLRPAATSGDRDVAAVAATALWRGAADAGPALSLVGRYVDSDDHWDKRVALDLLAEIGPAARAHTAPLHRLLAGEDNQRLRMAAARALWRITNDAEPVLAVYGRLWSSHPPLRGPIAAGYVEMGRAAEPACPLLADEIRRPRRHNVDRHTGSSHQVVEDEKLLDDCRTVLAAIAGPQPT